MKKTIQTGLASLSALAVAFAPRLAFAQGDFPDLSNAPRNLDIIRILDNIVTFILGLAGAIAVIYLIWAGIQYITGGAKGAQAAKDAIVNAIIGIVVILLAYVIVNAVVTAVLEGSV